MTTIHRIEEIKQSSRHLRGDLHTELFERQDPGVTEDSRQLLKFHGIYQQEDRDSRQQLKKAGLSPRVSFMVRIATAAGRLTADQYLALDHFTRTHKSPGIRLTSRQAVQIHGVVKTDLAPFIRSLHEKGLTSWAGCGDVVRNVTMCPKPDQGIRRQVVEVALATARRLKPRSHAYLELFIERQKVFESPESEPLYGESYLPRKFKLGFTVAGDNCIDVFSHDLALVAHPDRRQQIRAWTVLAGGGLAQSRGLKSTHARLAEPLGTVFPEQLDSLIDAVITVQRDFGHRDDRQHARLKYLVDEWGLAKFRRTVADRAGISFGKSSPIVWEPESDHLLDSDNQVGVWIPQGRIVDTATMRLQTGLARAVEEFRPDIVLTPQQNVLLVGLDNAQRHRLTTRLAEFGIPPADAVAPMRRHAMACPALPTCGLALTDAERIFPSVLQRIETLWQSEGLAPQDVRVRMTGCPNNCARPFLAEIGLVGASPGRYDILVGGSVQGTRLNRLIGERIALSDLEAVLGPLFRQYRQDRQPLERFGDWCHRRGIGIAPRAGQSLQGGTPCTM